MNWENYKRLTIKQKEEYNFRFKKKENFDIYGLSLIVTNIFLIMIVLYFTSYMIITLPSMEQYKSEILTYVSFSGRLVVVISIFIIGYILEFIYRVIKHSYQYNKWKKENKIVITTWWSKWRK